jgi:hypothetical protein
MFGLCRCNALWQRPISAAPPEEARAGFERWVQILQQEIATFQAADHTRPIPASLGSDRQLRETYGQSLATAHPLAARSIQSTEGRGHRSTVPLGPPAARLPDRCAGPALVSVAFWLVRSIAIPVYRLVALLTRPEPSAGFN